MTLGIKTMENKWLYIAKAISSVGICIFGAAATCSDYNLLYVGLIMIILIGMIWSKELSDI